MTYILYFLMGEYSFCTLGYTCIGINTSYDNRPTRGEIQPVNAKLIVKKIVRSSINLLFQIGLTQLPVEV